jgi:hypothetical protein
MLPKQKLQWEEPHSSARPGTGWLSMMLCALVMAWVATLPVIAMAQRSAQAKVTEDLPSGAMQAKATTACVECHEARIILQQRLSKAAWTKEVDKMIKWGAMVEASDHDALIDYLSSNFRPDQPPYEAPRTAVEKNSQPKK